MTNPQPTDSEMRLAKWLDQEMPEGTVIGNPSWWAPRILKAISASDALRPSPGDTWFVKLPGASTLTEVEVKEVTDQTVVIRGDLLQQWMRSSPQRYAIRDLTFVERRHTGGHEG